MAKAKKGKSKDKADGADSAQAATDAKPPSKLGAILVPLVAFLAAGGASFALTGSPAPAAPVPTIVDTPKPVAWSPPKPAKTVAIAPILVSLGEPDRVLKLGLALELTESSLEPDTPRLRDAFTGYVRTIGPEAISDPNFHSQLKRQLLHRARMVHGVDTVSDVLITDFMISR